MKKIHNAIFIIITISYLLSITYVLSSCSKNGYGCHGNSKYITRVR